MTGAPVPDSGPGPGRRPMDDEIDVYGLTHTGKVRKNNEDHFLICSLQKQIKLFHTSLPDASRVGGDERVAFISVVADGVGGHKGGEEQAASRSRSNAIHRGSDPRLLHFDPEDDAAFMRLLEQSRCGCTTSLPSARRSESVRGMRRL